MTNPDADMGRGWLKPFDSALKVSGLYPLTSIGISVFQVNMGRLCNQSCRHCHVDAGTGRTESMDAGMIKACLGVLDLCRYPTLDITGGAPEMNPGYRAMVSGACALGARVKTRTSLTILLEKGFDDLPGFFAANRVEVIASLPYYLASTADAQRGQGSFAASVEAIRRLNREGYGMEGAALS